MNIKTNKGLFIPLSNLVMKPSPLAYSDITHPSSFCNT